MLRPFAMSGRLSRWKRANGAVKLSQAKAGLCSKLLHRGSPCDRHSWTGRPNARRRIRLRDDHQREIGRENRSDARPQVQLFQPNSNANRPSADRCTATSRLVVSIVELRRMLFSDVVLRFPDTLAFLTCIFHIHLLLLQRILPVQRNFA